MNHAQSPAAAVGRDPNPNADVLNAALPPDPWLPVPADSADVPSGLGARSWVPIRGLTTNDRVPMLDHLLALNASDRRLRFGHLASDDHIRSYVERLDLERDLLVGVFDRSLRLVAQAHLAFLKMSGPAVQEAGDAVPGARACDLHEAEFSVSVLPRSRGQGMGSLLFEHAVTAARNRGVGRLWIHLLRENAAMLAIVQRAGAQIDFDGRDATAQLTLPGESLLSRLGACVGQGAAELDYRLKLQSLRLDRRPSA